jgi:hypothetical protein
LLRPLGRPARNAATPTALGSLRRLGKRCAGVATIVAAVAIVVWLAVLLALDPKPALPPLGRTWVAPAKAIDGDAQPVRLRPVPALPARIAPERRHVKRHHERRRAHRPAPAAVPAHATARPVATAPPAPVVASPAPSVAPPPARPAPAPAPARPNPQPRGSGQPFDSSG